MCQYPSGHIHGNGSSILLISFLKPDAVWLRGFIKRFMKYGDRRNLIIRIEKGKIRPSKALADSLRSIMKGNRKFIMIDDQKEVYEETLYLAAHSNEKTRMS
jgi:hypothetical protein